jgi:hypothetical protein
MPPRGTVPPGTPRGRGKFPDDVEVCPLNTLHDKLRDAVASPNRHRTATMIDEIDQDLAPISGVDRSRSVEDRDAAAGGKSGPRMHQSHAPFREGDRDAGRNECPLSRIDRHILDRSQIGAGVTGMSVVGQRQILIETPQRDRGHTVGSRGLYRPVPAHLASL